MIFQHTLNQVLDSTKTQTRRLVKPGDMAWVGKTNKTTLVDGVDVNQGTFKRWQVGQTYAVCPERGKPSVARIKVTAIRRERIQDIAPDDARAEMGNEDDNPLYDAYLESGTSDADVDFIEEYPCHIFKWIWNHIHTRAGERWSDNPEVWVIEFVLVD